MWNKYSFSWHILYPYNILRKPFNTINQEPSKYLYFSPLLRITTPEMRNEGKDSYVTNLNGIASIKIVNTINVQKTNSQMNYTTLTGWIIQQLLKIMFLRSCNNMKKYSWLNTPRKAGQKTDVLRSPWCWKRPPLLKFCFEEHTLNSYLFMPNVAWTCSEIVLCLKVIIYLI